MPLRVPVRMRSLEAMNLRTEMRMDMRMNMSEYDEEKE